MAASVKDVYVQRLKEIFEEHNPAKVGKAARLVSKKRYEEHKLYLKVCEKYGVEPEAEYTGEVEDEPEAESDDPFASDEDNDAGEDEPAPEEDAEEDAEEDPFESGEESEEKDPDDYPEPQAFLLVFRQSGIKQGGGLWEGNKTQLNEDNKSAPNYADFNLLTKLKDTLMRDSLYTFRLSFLGPNGKDRHVDFKQSSLPFAEEAENFEEITEIPEDDDFEGFAGVYQADGAELFQTADGTKFGLVQEQSDGVSERGMMGPDKSMCEIVELRVAVPAVVRMPLIKDADDLEGNVDAKESDEGVTYNNGSAEFSGEGYLSINNADFFKGRPMKKTSTIAVWCQWPKTQALAHVMTKGPWRKCFSMGLRHTRGEGNTIRFSMTGGQGQKHVSHVVKPWSAFPELDDKELQALIKEEEDRETWFHFAMTLGDSTFTAFVNGEEVGSQKFHGNAMVRNANLRLGSGGTGDSADDGFYGRLFDLMIFEACLSKDAVQAMYQQGLQRAKDITRREKASKAGAEEAAAQKRAEPTSQYMKMMNRMKKRGK